MSKTDLYVTCKGLLWLLDDGLIEPTDLDKGLFAFGCTREYVFGDSVDRMVALSDENNWLGRDKHKIQMIIVEILQPAVAKAEREGRLLWRADDMPHMTVGRVNQLLAANLHRTFQNAEYNQYFPYGNLEELAAVELPAIEVVWEKSQKFWLLRQTNRISR